MRAWMRLRRGMSAGKNAMKKTPVFGFARFVTPPQPDQVGGAEEAQQVIANLTGLEQRDSRRGPGVIA
jgi:hypothetical protein